MSKLKCTGCEETLPVSSFSKNSHSKSGYQCVCKKCYKKRYAKTYKKKYIRTADLGDNLKKPKFTEDQLSDQIKHLKQSNTGFDYSFLFKNEKFSEKTGK
jgi:recombinational DNA repair protein (RecF pathway)